jgi:hypothetical protein
MDVVIFNWISFNKVCVHITDTWCDMSKSTNTVYRATFLVESLLNNNLELQRYTENKFVKNFSAEICRLCSVPRLLVLLLNSWQRFVMIYIYTGHTQKNGAVLIAFTIETAPFFCVYPVYIKLTKVKYLLEYTFCDGKMTTRKTKKKKVDVWADYCYWYRLQRCRLNLISVLPANGMLATDRRFLMELAIVM